jgi:phage terminase small subunit
VTKPKGTKGKKPPKAKGKPAGKAKPPASAPLPPLRLVPPRMAQPPGDDEDLFDGEFRGGRLGGAPGGRLGAGEDDEDDDEDDAGVEAAARPIQLNPKQRAFAEHYARLGNATKACEAAGYEGTKHSLEVMGSRLLKHVEVKRYLDDILDACAKPRIADAAERHQFLTTVMRGDAKGKTLFFGVQVETRPTFSERVKAAELLSKINGELTEKRDVKGDLVIRVVRGDSAPSALAKREDDDA